MSDQPKYPIRVRLSGEDGNTGAIMGRVSRAIRAYLHDEGKLTPAEIAAEVTAYREETMSGDYDNVLQTAMKWVNVT
jgi:hypothetical protein